MGGLALKNTFTRRYERAEFEIITAELTGILKKTFKQVTMPLFYKNKKSFGDADFIISMDGFNQDMFRYITDTFTPSEIFHNGNCWTFDYNELQVDLITVSGENFHSNEMYFSYNDLGNFIGRIAQSFGLKFGQEGLWYEHYFKGTNLGSNKPIIVSKNYREIYEFLGLSFERWEQGFDELEDIFEFIATSKFFNWERFQIHTLDKVNRERNLKRKSYMSFLEWIDKNVRDDNHKYVMNKSPELTQELIAANFPEAKVELAIRELEYEHCKALYIKAKFNGGDVRSKYGFEGKELGLAITGFKTWIFDNYKESYDDVIMRLTVNQIYANFDMFLKTRKQNA